MGFCQSYDNFFGVFDPYNPNSGTLITPVGKLGIAYHEMNYVSAFPYGKFPHEERFLPSGKFEQWKKVPVALEIF